MDTGKDLHRHNGSGSDRDAANHRRDVIHAIENPVHKMGGIKILKGNLAPEGAVTKPSAIPEKALVFRGKGNRGERRGSEGNQERRGQSGRRGGDPQ